MILLLLILLPTVTWAQDQVNTPAIVFDSSAVTTCTSRKAVSGGLAYCDEAGVIQTIGASTEARCGDGNIDSTSPNNEQCDGTNAPSGCTCNGPGTTDECRCVYDSVCGNNTIETGAAYGGVDEVCDPPGSIATVTDPNGCTGALLQCSTGCAACEAAPVACDDDVASGGPCPATDCCDPPWTTSTCTGGEVCNGLCSDCTLCGNGVIDGAEECDHKAPAETGSCPGICLPDCTCPSTTQCGNGVVEPPEVCDDGPAGSADCTTDCRRICDCADNIIETGCSGGFDEECNYYDQASTDFGKEYRDTNAAAIHAYWTNPLAPISQGSSGDLTIEFWVYVENLPTTGAYYGLVQKYGGPTPTYYNGWKIYLYTYSGTTRLVVDVGDNTAADASWTTTGASAVTEDTWHHFAVVLSSTANTTTVYRAGVTDVSHTALAGSQSPAWRDPSATTASLSVFRNGMASGSAVIDDVRVWSSARTAAQIDGAFLSMLSSPYDASLLYYYTFDTATANLVPNMVTTSPLDTQTLEEQDQTAVLDTDYEFRASTLPLSTGTAPVSCTPPEICTTSCTCVTSGGGGGATYYISPTGNDGAAGTTGAPWKTFNRAFNTALSGTKMQPGDTLVLKDGTYTAATTGLLKLQCPYSSRSWGHPTDYNLGAFLGGGVAANHGNATAPITITAENVRGAYLKADGRDGAINLNGCEYYILDGLRADTIDWDPVTAGNCSQIQSTVDIWGGANIKLKRLLVGGTGDTTIGARRGSNRYDNEHALQLYMVSKYIMDGTTGDNLVEQCEVYDYHRHGITIVESKYTTVRQNYVNPRGDVDPMTICGVQPADPSGIPNYGASYSLYENNIVEGTGDTFNTMGGGLPNGVRGGSYSTWVGNIALATWLNGGGGSSRGYDPDGIRGNRWSHHVVLGAASPWAQRGFQLGVQRAATIEHLTSIGSSCEGFEATDPGYVSCRVPAGGTLATVTQACAERRCTAGATQDISCTQLCGYGGPTAAVCGFSLTNSYIVDVEEYGAYPRGGCNAKEIRVTSVFDDSSGGVNLCTVTDNYYGSGGSIDIGAGCTTSGNAATSITGIARSGANKCVTHDPANGGRGADARCLYSGGVRSTGVANSVFRQTAKTGACTTTSWTPSLRCTGGFVGCQHLVTGVNTVATKSCYDVHERLNILSTGGGCSLSGVECPA